MKTMGFVDQKLTNYGWERVDISIRVCHSYGLRWISTDIDLWGQLSL